MDSEEALVLFSHCYHDNSEWLKAQLTTEATSEIEKQKNKAIKGLGALSILENPTFKDPEYDSLTQHATQVRDEQLRLHDIERWREEGDLAMAAVGIGPIT
jgi:hypothetical protein